MALFGGRQKQAERRIGKILIVEDEPLIAFDNEYVLQDAGYQVVASVDTAAAAIRAIGTHRPDLVLADVNLSQGGTGLEVAQAAHAAGVVVIFVTGRCPMEARSLAAGCLSKPYNSRDLLAAIEAIDAKLEGRKPKRVPKSFTVF